MYRDLSQPPNSCLVILAFVAATALREIATDFRKRLLRLRSASSADEDVPPSASVRQTVAIWIWWLPWRRPRTFQSKSQNFFTRSQLNQGMNLAETVKFARAGLLVSPPFVLRSNCCQYWTASHPHQVMVSWDLHGYWKQPMMSPIWAAGRGFRVPL